MGGELSIDVVTHRIHERCKLNYCYIIDNGSYAYAIVSIDGVPHFIDPHVHEGINNLEVVPFENEVLKNSRGWMVLEVPPFGSK